MNRWPSRRVAYPWAARPVRWAAAVTIALGAVLVRLWWLEPVLQGTSPFIQSYPAVLVAAWIGGFVGGILATAASILAITYLLLSPEGAFGVASVADQLTLAIFGALGILVGAVLHARKESQRRATESEERYRSLVELSPDAVFVHAHGRIAYVNATTVRLLGAADAAQLMGRSSFDFVAPASQDLARSRTQQLYSETKRVPPVEQLWVRLDGRELPVEVTAARVPWGAGEAVQVIFRDISERKRADEERQALLERAEAARVQSEEANRLKEEFLAVLSHELRTPLNAVLGWARVIKKGVSRPEHLTHALTVIERNAAAQVQIIEDLLDVSRIITGRFRLAMAPMDLRQAATNAMESVRPAASAKDLTLNVTLPPEDVVVLGDAVRLQQVAWNLLTNAVKFTEPGGLVNLTVRHLGADAELMVSDTGLGISAEFLPHVFDRFRQQDSSSTRASSGLGLGLSLVRHLVEAHGGRVNASSPGLGSGSTFAVRLPIAGARRALPPDSALDRPASELTASPGAE